MTLEAERLNVVLAARDREFARQMDANVRRIERFAAKSQRNLSKASRSFDVLGAAARAAVPFVGALGAAQLVSSLNNTAEKLDNIGKTADRLGFTTDALQEFRAVAEQSGVSVTTFDMAMQRFGRRLAEARLGSGEAKNAFAEMGIALLDGAGQARPMEAVLDDVANAMSNMSEQTDRNRLAMRLFDSEGVALVNMLREGADGMDAMRAEAREMGVVIREDVIRSAEESRTQLDLMSRVIDANLSSALINLAPLLVSAAQGIASITSAVSNFLSVSSGLGSINLAPSLEDQASEFDALNGQLEEYRDLRQSYNDLLNSPDASVEQVQAQTDAYEAAASALREAVTQQESFEDFKGTLGDIKSETDAAREKAELSKMSAEQVERERISKERIAILDKAIAQAQASGDPLSDQGLQDLDQLLDRWESAQVSLIPKSSIGVGGGRSGGGGGGSSRVSDAARDAKREAEDLARALERLNETALDTGFSADDFADGVRMLNEQFQAGQIDARAYRNGLDDIRDGLRDAADGAERLAEMSADTFTSILTGSKSAKDAVADLAGQFASMAARSAFMGLFGGSGLFRAISPIFNGPSFDGGGHTGSGMRAGGMDGKGGYLAMVHPNESVIDHTKSVRPAAAAGRGQMVININGATGNAEVRDMVAEGVRTGLEYDRRHILPGSVQAILNDPRRRG